MTVKFPDRKSVVEGKSLERLSVPVAATNQEPLVVPELKVQVKSAEAFGAKVGMLAGVVIGVQTCAVPLSFVRALSPVFVSVTTTVTVVFASTVAPGETLLVVSVVAG